MDTAIARCDGDSMSFGDDVGARIKAARGRRKLTQRKLAEALDTRVASISEYENGHVVPSAEMIAKIARALDVSSSYLLCESDMMEPPRAPSEPPERANDPAFLAFLKTRMGQGATDAEIASLRDLTPYNGRATPDTYAHMLTVLRTTVEPDPDAEARFRASGYMRSSLDRFKKK